MERIQWILSKWTNLVERRGKCHQSLTGNSSVCGLKAKDSTKSGRLTNGTTGIGTEGHGSHSSGNSHSRPARRAPGNPVMIPWVSGNTHCRVFRGRSHCKLVHIGLSKHHGTGRQKPRHSCCRIDGTVVCKNSGCTGRGETLYIQIVLDRNGITIKQ